MTRYLIRIVSYAWDPMAKKVRQSPLYAVSISKAQLEPVMATLYGIPKAANMAKVKPRGQDAGGKNRSHKLLQ
ncbi:MAG: hypothetical protein JRN66_05795 [Nitrososphaerota archaeon]|jgi:hypothetical protein|nr:hypothetical protein [Nitrososphaerota archaeon]